MSLWSVLFINPAGVAQAAFTLHGLTDDRQTDRQTAGHRRRQTVILELLFSVNQSSYQSAKSLETALVNWIKFPQRASRRGKARLVKTKKKKKKIIISPSDRRDVTSM